MSGSPLCSVLAFARPPLRCFWLGARSLALRFGVRPLPLCPAVAVPPFCVLCYVWPFACSVVCAPPGHRTCLCPVGAVAFRAILACCVVSNRRNPSKPTNSVACVFLAAGFLILQQQKQEEVSAQSGRKRKGQAAVTARSGRRPTYREGEGFRGGGIGNRTEFNC